VASEDGVGEKEHTSPAVLRTEGSSMNEEVQLEEISDQGGDDKEITRRHAAYLLAAIDDFVIVDPPFIITRPKFARTHAVA
jgi:hypothetical protein